MRICLVTPYDLSHDGGVNRHIIALGRALVRLRHQVQILGPASGAVPAHCDGLPGVVRVSANGSVARVGLLVSRRGVRDYLGTGRFDVVHVHEPWVPGIARHVVAAAAAPVVGTFHTYAESEPVAVRLLRQALAVPRGRIHHAVAVSPAAAEFAGRVFRGPLQVVPNGVDLACFGRPAGVRLVEHGQDGPLSGRPLRLLFVGRYDEPRKGLRYLLAAAARLRAAGRAVDVQIVGGGRPDAFATAAERAGGRFLGRVSDVALAEAYRTCDMFCAPSTHGESFGSVLIEAMACGRPVIASDIRGYRDAAGGAALLVRPADAQALAGAILRIAGDDALRAQFVRRGTERARTFEWGHLAREICTVYEGMLSGTGARCARVPVPA